MILRKFGLVSLVIFLLTISCSPSPMTTVEISESGITAELPTFITLMPFKNTDKTPPGIDVHLLRQQYFDPSEKRTLFMEPSIVAMYFFLVVESKIPEKYANESIAEEILQKVMLPGTSDTNGRRIEKHSNNGIEFYVSVYEGGDTIWATAQLSGFLYLFCISTGHTGLNVNVLNSIRLP
jgi:hypothetical protein